MKTHKETEVVIKIVEKVNKKDFVKTTLTLEVEYEDINDDLILRKTKSSRIIQVDVVSGDTTEKYEYTADGYVSMEDIMSVHNEIFTDFFNPEKKTNITLIDRTTGDE